MNLFYLSIVASPKHLRYSMNTSTSTDEYNTRISLHPYTSWYATPIVKHENQWHLHALE